MNQPTFDACPLRLLPLDACLLTFAPYPLFLDDYEDEINTDLFTYIPYQHPLIGSVNEG